MAARAVARGGLWNCVDNSAAVNTTGNFAYSTIGSADLLLAKTNSLVWINGGTCNVGCQIRIPIA